jgi:hypothetical protein
MKTNEIKIITSYENRNGIMLKRLEEIAEQHKGKCLISHYENIRQKLV